MRGQKVRKSLGPRDGAVWGLLLQVHAQSYPQILWTNPLHRITQIERRLEQAVVECFPGKRFVGLRAMEQYGMLNASNLGSVQ